MLHLTIFRIGTTTCVLALGLMSSTALAGTVLTLPATGSGAVDGSGLAVTNTEDNQGAGTPRPFAIAGTGTGKNAGGVWGYAGNAGGFGVYGQTRGAGSHGVYGYNTGSGEAGFFLLDGASTTSTDTAIYGENRGGSTSASGDYGTAAFFDVSNAFNEGSAVLASTNGTGNAIHGVQTGARGDAALFEIDGPKNADVAVNATTAGLGHAGYFDITNKASGSSAVYATTVGTGTPIHAFLSNATHDGTSNSHGVATSTGAVFGDDETPSGTDASGISGYSTNNIAIYGKSTNASAKFIGGRTSHSAQVEFTGGSSWNFSSDRNLKEAFVPADTDSVLDHLAAMPVYTYRFKDSESKAVFLGPTAQDFAAAFHFGDAGDTMINEGSALGVAFAASKGLYEKVKADEATIAADHARIAALEAALAGEKAVVAKAVEDGERLARLEAAVARLSRATRPIQQARLVP